jgi:sulfotransferase family protein
VAIQIIGAGLGRTGTTSLKAALEILLKAPCYHMANISHHPDHINLWHSASQGDHPNWSLLFQNYAAVTDWPAAAFYKELMPAYPEAKILLSFRESEAWFKSCQNTIFPKILSSPGEWGDMIRSVVFNTFCEDLNDRNSCIAAYEKHNEEVRHYVPADRLIEWQPGDNWAPLCEALNLPEPDEPYPYVNKTKDFIAHNQ